jgi:nucleolar protein 53
MKVTNSSQKLASSTKKPKSHQVLQKTARSAIGAPAQHNQSSRKGKRAWRKNVDIEDVEGGLEEMRVEERVIG